MHAKLATSYYTLQWYAIEGTVLSSKRQYTRFEYLYFIFHCSGLKFCLIRGSAHADKNLCGKQ